MRAKNASWLTTTRIMNVGGRCNKPINCRDCAPTALITRSQLTPLVGNVKANRENAIGPQVRKLTELAR